MCDCEPNQFERIEYRKARKSHKCYECGTPINPGDNYQYFKALNDGHFFTFKTCNDCAKLRDWIDKKTDCCVMFGEISMELRELDILCNTDQTGDGEWYIDPDYEGELEIVSGDKGDKVRLKS